LTKKVNGTGPSNVYLLSIVSRKDQDVMRCCVIRQAEYCRLDCREVATRTNQDRVLRATVQWLLCRILARFAVDSRYSSACLEQAKK